MAARQKTALPAIKHIKDEDVYEIKEEGITYLILDEELSILKHYFNTHKNVTMAIWYKNTDPLTRKMVHRQGNTTEEI